MALKGLAKILMVLRELTRRLEEDDEEEGNSASGDALTRSMLARSSSVDRREHIYGGKNDNHTQESGGDKVESYAVACTCRHADSIPLVQ